MPCSVPERPARYSEDEQRRRWALIIAAILNDPGVPPADRTEDAEQQKPDSRP